MGIYYVTFATHDMLYFPYFIESCKRHKIDVNVLGWGGTYKSHLWRLHVLLKYLAELGDNDIVCWTDCYDAIYVKDNKEIEETFKRLTQKYNRRFIISRENQWDHKLGISVYKDCNGKYLNAGTYIGYVDALKTVIGKICELNETCDKKGNDQTEFTRLCRDNSTFFNKHISLDMDMEMFYMGGDGFVHNFDLPKYIKHYKEVGACVVHCPGHTNMNKLIRHLGYDMTVDQDIKISQDISLSRVKKRQLAMVIVSIFLWLLIIFILICSGNRNIRKR